MELSLFQTRALAYNHLPAIHSLFPRSEEMKQKSVDDYFNYRLAMVQQHPGTIQWVHSLTAELDTNVAARVIQGTNINWYRHEWGQNANPHIHKLAAVESLNESLSKWKKCIMEKFQSILHELESVDVSNMRPKETEAITNQHTSTIVTLWKECVA